MYLKNLVVIDSSYPHTHAVHLRRTLNRLKCSVNQMMMIQIEEAIRSCEEAIADYQHAGKKRPSNGR
jgi:hypothetical protein